MNTCRKGEETGVGAPLLGKTLAWAARATAALTLALTVQAAMFSPTYAFADELTPTSQTAIAQNSDTPIDNNSASTSNNAILAADDNAVPSEKPTNAGSASKADASASEAGAAGDNASSTENKASDSSAPGAAGAGASNSSTSNPGTSNAGAAGAGTNDKNNGTAESPNDTKTSSDPITDDPTKDLPFTTIEDGTYIIENECGTVLDVAAAGTEDGTNVQGWQNNSTGAQRFVVKKEGVDEDGHDIFSISAQDSGKALDVASAENRNGANVQIYQHNGTVAQRWRLVASTTADGAPCFVIVSCLGDKALALSGATSGANARIWTISGSAVQNWIFRLVPSPSFSSDIKNGAYVIENECGMVLDVAGASSEDGANVQGYQNNDTIAQRWYVKKIDVDENGNAIYSFTSVLSSKVLDIASGNNADDTNVQIYQKNSTVAQSWRLVASTTADGAPCFIIVSCLGDKALDLAGTGLGDNVRIWARNGTSSQKWIFRLCPATVADGAYVIKKSNDNGDYAIDIDNASAENGANARMWAENDTNAQAFAIKYDYYTGYYTITNYASGKVLDVESGSTYSGANVQQYVSNKTAAQLWRIIQHADGTISFASAKSNKLLTLAAALGNGTNLIIRDASDSPLQRFKLATTTPKVSEGTFNIADSNVNGDFVWDIPAGSMESGTGGQLYLSNGTLAQKFVIESDGEGAYYLRPVISGLYISADESGNITQQAKSDSLVQRWFIVPTDDGHFTFASISNGKLIGVSNIGLSATLLANANAAHTGWNFINVPLLTSGYYTIKLAENADTALEVYYNSASAGGNISSWHAADDNSQKFYLMSNGNDIYTIYGGWSMMPWDVTSGAAKAGANIQQYYDNGTNAQKWQILWRDGAFIFKSALGEFALGLTNTTAGANAQLASFDASSATQRFLLNHTTLNRASISDLIATLDEYATGNGLKTFKSPKSLSSDTVDAIWDALYGFWDIGTSVGFTLIDLTTGAGITYNSDTVYYSACSIKAPYSIALSEYVPSALDEWRGSFWHALDYSNNETYMNYFYNYGRWPLEYYNEIGHVENFSWAGWTANYTAEDLCRMWVVSQEYLLGGTDNAAWLRDTLGQNSAGMTRMSVSKYGASPVYAKSGWTDTARTEGCLVMDGDHPYVCAIMSTTNIEHSDLLMNLADALYRAHRDLMF